MPSGDVIRATFDEREERCLVYYRSMHADANWPALRAAFNGVYFMLRRITKCRVWQAAESASFCTPARWISYEPRPESIDASESQASKLLRSFDRRHVEMSVTGNSLKVAIMTVVKL